MENKLKLSIENRLVEVRNESLKKLNETTLRPHGKLWGMDVFSWYNPDINVLTNTLHSFPFKVIWVGNLSDIEKALKIDASISFQLKTIISYDGAGTILLKKEFEKIENVLGINSLKDGFKLLKTFKAKNTVLLYTASEKNWKENKAIFEEFITIHQNK